MADPLLSVERAGEILLEHAAQVSDTETVALADADGRVLCEDVASRITQPPFAASAMDGYAVRAADIAAVPATLKLIGEAPAGRAFTGAIKAGETVRIFTGAPLPEGSDTILIQENTERDGDLVTALESAPSGKFVRPAGLDFKAGEVLLAVALCLLQAAFYGWLGYRTFTRRDL